MAKFFKKGTGSCLTRQDIVWDNERAVTDLKYLYNVSFIPQSGQSLHHLQGPRAGLAHHGTQATAVTRQAELMFHTKYHFDQKELKLRGILT